MTTGQILSLTAHAFSKEEDAYVFSILMRGTPDYYVDTVRVPADIVETVYRRLSRSNVPSAPDLHRHALTAAWT